MHSNAPPNYICPICTGLHNPRSKETLIVEDDFVYKDEVVSVFVNSFFVGKNLGHVVVVPNEHYENIYDLPHAVGHHLFDVAQKMAITMKETYKTDGITLRQNNEPSGDQHAFHFHLHIFPRYENDGFNAAQGTKRSTTPEERKPYAEKLRSYLKM